MTLPQKLVWLSALALFGMHAPAAFAETLVLCDSNSAELKGESQAAGAPGCVELLSWTWGVSSPVGQLGSGSGTGQATYSPLSFQKFVDSSSTTFFKFLTTGTHFVGTLQLRVYGNCPQNCPTPTPYLTIDLSGPYVSTQSSGGSGDDRPTESISLAFKTAKLCYRIADPQSGVLATAVCETYTVPATP